METSVTYLRNHMSIVLRAADLNDDVTLTVHGKPKYKLTRIKTSSKKRPKLIDDPFIGMGKDDKEPVDKIMDRLRGGRFRDL